MAHLAARGTEPHLAPGRAACTSRAQLSQFVFAGNDTYDPTNPSWRALRGGYAAVQLGITAVDAQVSVLGSVRAGPEVPPAAVITCAYLESQRCTAPAALAPPCVPHPPPPQLGVASLSVTVKSGPNGGNITDLRGRLTIPREWRLDVDFDNAPNGLITLREGERPPKLALVALTSCEGSAAHCP